MHDSPSKQLALNGKLEDVSKSALRQSSQIKVKINKDGSTSFSPSYSSNAINQEKPSPLTQSAQQQNSPQVASLLKKSTLSIQSHQRRTQQGDYLKQSQQTLGKTTTLNIAKVKDRTNNNVTPSTVYNPAPANVAGNTTEFSFNANSTYH